MYKPTDYERSEKITEIPWRSPFRRDYARLVHSPAFRRLQGKTQLFAGQESDFFRNRLTHSLEVAQIAKSIVLFLNHKFKSNIDPDLVEFAGLAHDLGHPPFGHEGERILNSLMKMHGGFEGNAQTLRILTKLEKKIDDISKQLDTESVPGKILYKANSIGLNLCFRSLASVLKYDEKIPASLPNDKVVKGYYSSEEEIVNEIKRNVGLKTNYHFKTVECQIMELADDIANSTYDLEDAFKARILTPADLVAADPDLLKDVAARTEKELKKEINNDFVFTYQNAKAVIHEVFETYLKGNSDSDKISYFKDHYIASKNIAQNGFLRTDFTSDLVNEAIFSISIENDEAFPHLSKVTINEDIRKRIAVLKHLAFIKIVNSNNLQIVEYRSKKIITEIFEAIEGSQNKILPEDFSERYSDDTSSSNKSRIICDFIASMTDRYAIEFYSRLKSEGFNTMLRPYE